MEFILYFLGKKLEKITEIWYGSLYTISMINRTFEEVLKRPNELKWFLVLSFCKNSFWIDQFPWIFIHQSICEIKICRQLAGAFFNEKVQNRKLSFWRSPENSVEKCWINVNLPNWALHLWYHMDNFEFYRLPINTK